MRAAISMLALSLGLLFWTVTADAQSKTARVGYLIDRSGPNELDEAFVRGMADRGWIVGQNLVIEYRWTDGKGDRLPGFAADLVARNVDVIVTQGAATTLAAKKATTTIPIVMASSQDAVADGLVTSLARPGGNVTGRSLYATELTGKRLQMIKEMVPGLTRVGALWDATNPGGLNQFKEAVSAGKVLGLTIVSLDVQIPDGIEGAMTKATETQAGAVIVLSSSATISHRSQIGEAARRHRLPTIFANKEYLRGGGLLSYGPDLVDSFRLAAVHVDKILKGAKPADLPVEQPTKFELVINAKTAKALGLMIPPTLLAFANEVIE